MNGVSQIHTKLLKTQLFRSFYDIFPTKFQNKTNGVTHRRWIGCTNPGLAQLYTDELGSKDWMTDLELTKKLLSKLDDAQFRERWNDIKQHNKRKLIEVINERMDIELREDSILDVMVKRIHEYKRQLMNALRPQRGQIMRTPCNHKFHVGCLVEWMSIKMECPTCRARLPTLE